jgi:transcriptional regulator with GAF, ATPase, and Fis domain
VATELFGHSRGAFTGAVRDRPGLFQAADGGTLFLDEIAETPDLVQASMLTVLDSGSVMAVGSTRTTRVDVRTVTATHRDLDQLVAEGRFRRDLFHRLETAVIAVPPLRQRRVDVPILVAHFLELGGSGAMAQLRAAPEAMFWMADVLEALRDAPWSGNVRQLQGWTSHLLGLIARGMPTTESPWPDASSVAAMVPTRESSSLPVDVAEDDFSSPDATPSPSGERITETERLFADADALERALTDRFEGNVASLARWAAIGLGLRESAARRRVYDVLGPDRIALLRSRASRGR